MFAVEVYAAVRHFVFIEGNSRREAARVFGLSRETVSKMCRFSLPPGYTRTKPVKKPKLGTLLPVIDAILEADGTAPSKQRHSAKRIFERLRDEHGYAGGLTVVRDYVRVARAQRAGDLRAAGASPRARAGRLWRGDWRDRRRPAEDPLLLHGRAAVGRAVREGLPGGDDGSVSRRSCVGVRFFGGVPLSVLYDNTTIAVAKICGDGRRERTRAFTELSEPLPVPRPLWPSRQGQRQGQGRGAGEVCPIELHDADPAGGKLRRSQCHAGRALPAPTGRTRRSPQRDDRRASRRRPGGLPGSARRAAGGVREAGGAGLVDRPGPLPLQRLLGADGIRLPGCCGEGLRRRGGDPVRRRADRPTSPLPMARGPSCSTRCTTSR